MCTFSEQIPTMGSRPSRKVSYVLESATLVWPPQLVLVNHICEPAETVTNRRWTCSPVLQRWSHSGLNAIKFPSSKCGLMMSCGSPWCCRRRSLQDTLPFRVTTWSSATHCRKSESCERNVPSVCILNTVHFCFLCEVFTQKKKKRDLCKLCIQPFYFAALVIKHNSGKSSRMRYLQYLQ